MAVGVGWRQGTAAEIGTGCSWSKKQRAVETAGWGARKPARPGSLGARPTLVMSEGAGARHRWETFLHSAPQPRCRHRGDGELGRLGAHCDKRECDSLDAPSLQTQAHQRSLF